MAEGALVRVIVSVSDLDRSLRFYRDVLGCDELYRQDDVAMLQIDGGPQLMLHRRPPTPGLASVALSFAAIDVDQLTDRAVLAGATVIDPAADQPWRERQSVLADPDGHVICLVAPLGS